MAHALALHFVQPVCTGDEPRVAVYFRVTAPARGALGPGRPEALSLDGLFCEMPGLLRHGL